LWIADKRVFKKPTSVNVEFVSADPFDWVIADASGKEVKTVPDDNSHGHGGWTGLHFASLGLYGDYSIGFRSSSSKPQEIKQGDIEMK
jgi:hypothetical protein